MSFTPHHRPIITSWLAWLIKICIAKDCQKKGKKQVVKGVESEWSTEAWSNSRREGEALQLWRDSFPGPSLLFPLPPFLPTESLAPGIHLLTSPIATIPWCLPPINSLSPTAHRSYWLTPEPPTACHDISLDCPPRKYSQLFFTVPFLWKISLML